MDEVCLHIHRPAYVRTRRVLRCPRCRARRRHVITWWQWYGPASICCHCGAHVNDGELHRRTRRDARQAQIARQMWPTLPARIPPGWWDE